jgi:hypothetical protein
LYGVTQFLASAPDVPTAARPGAVTALGTNYPNPFNPRTTIAFSLARRGVVSLAVYDVAGRRVRTLVDGSRDAGPHTVAWDGRNDAGVSVASGVYFCKLVAGEFSDTRKLVLLK